MREQELLSRISELETLNRSLVTENERLREALGLPPKEIAMTENDTSLLISKESTTASSGKEASTC